jgi:bifunctional DNA-binding transcriptional regulator/antitoxin component of YhaV-PrlF toxin-antitoxin module
MGKKVSDDGIKKVVKMGSRGRVVIPNKFRRAIRMEQQVLIILDEKNKEIRIKPSVYKQMKLNELK